MPLASAGVAGWRSPALVFHARAAFAGDAPGRHARHLSLLHMTCHHGPYFGTLTSSGWFASDPQNGQDLSFCVFMVLDFRPCRRIARRFAATPDCLGSSLALIRIRSSLRSPSGSRCGLDSFLIGLSPRFAVGYLAFFSLPGVVTAVSGFFWSFFGSGAMRNVFIALR